MMNLTQLTLNSTIGQLTTYDFQVEANVFGRVVAERFQQQLELPGVIIAHKSQLVGMISRPKFREHFGAFDGHATYQNRPIRELLEFIRIPPLVLSVDWRIDEAVQTALNRSPELMYEPVIVVLEDHSLRLLDVRSLLLAQTHLVNLFKKTLKAQRIETKKYQEELKKGQEQLKEYSQILEIQSEMVGKTTNQQLDNHQLELLKQAQEIAQLNQRFIRIGQLISIEGKKAFQAAFDGASTMYRSTEQILEVGQVISKELETVNRSASLIGEIIKQVRYLGLQASIVANQSGSTSDGLSRVNVEIEKLMNQTLEAGTQVDHITSRFKVRFQELTTSAQGGTDAAKTVMQRIERAEMALSELEELVVSQDPDKIPVLQANVGKVDPVTANSLVKEIDRAEVALSNLERLVRHQNSKSLIHKIEQKLKHTKSHIR